MNADDDLFPAGWPILEFDPDRDAYIEPHAHLPKVRLPDRGVACFFNDVLERLCETGAATVVHRFAAEHETQPIYEVDHNGERFAAFNPGVGGPLAAGRLDSAIAMGLRKVMVCGSAGSLTSRLAIGQVAVPSAAIRDEGTSYHYLPPGREIEFGVAVTRRIEDVLQKHGVPYVIGKTWTTDAIFRETRGRVARRKGEGCVSVEMEAASMLAVARFRGVALGYLLYASDSLAGDDLDYVGWQYNSGREHLFWLAAEAVTRL